MECLDLLVLAALIVLPILAFGAFVNVICGE